MILPSFTIRDPFSRAPFLFPWYVNDTKPRLLKDGQQLRWTYLEQTDSRFAGITALEDAADVFGLIKTYTYLLPSNDHKAFSVWNRSYQDQLAGMDLRIDIFYASDLTKFDDVVEVKRGFNENENCPYLFGCEPRTTLNIPLPNNVRTFSYKMSEEMTGFDKFIVVTGIAGLYPEEKEANNTALVEIIPAENRIQIYPQDWFNLSETIDFGYQWITRAVRAQPSGKIIGEGIRITNFELDDTNREVLNI